MKVQECITALIQELAPDQGQSPSKAMALVLTLQAALASPRWKVEQEPYGYVEKHDFHALTRGQYTSINIHRTKSPIAGYGPSVPLYTHPAPASDELSEALKPLVDAEKVISGGQDGVSPERNIDVRMTYGDLVRIAAIAKHKGPQ